MARSRIRSASAALLVVSAVLADAPGDDRIRKWIHDLGSPTFSEREAATQALKEAGARARPGLEKALESPDVEVRCRAEEILWDIERWEKVGKIRWLGEPLAQQLAEQGLQMEEIDASNRLRLGVTMLQPLHDLLQRLGVEGGVLLGRIQPKSAAERGGLQAWDLVTRFNGVEVRSTADLQQAVREAPLKKPVRIELRRLVEEGKAVSLDLVLDDPPPEEEALAVRPGVAPVQVLPIQIEIEKVFEGIAPVEEKK